MELKYFKALNYRNITQCNIPFSPGVNLLLGENAQGKTNVTEGIYLFSRGKSHRGASDKEMTRFGEDGFTVEIGYTGGTGEHTLSYTYYKGERRRMRDGIRLERVTEMLGNFRSVLFCPDHLTLVKGGPEERRRFLDVGISGAHDAYIKYYSSYKNALEQRNALLKRASRGDAVDREELFAWSHYLAEYASYIYMYRKEYCESIANTPCRICATFAKRSSRSDTSRTFPRSTGRRGAMRWFLSMMKFSPRRCKENVPLARHSSVRCAMISRCIFRERKRVISPHRGNSAPLCLP